MTGRESLPADGDERDVVRPDGGRLDGRAGVGPDDSLRRTVGLARKAFGLLVREEWRLHADLFGGARLVGFPLVIAVVTGLGTWLLAVAAVPPADVLAGLHALAALVGLQVGTVGLVGRDALSDLLGDVTLLLFSARTLPLSWRTLLGTFLVKDLLFYTVAVVGPAFVGFGAVAATRGLAPSALAWGLLTTTLSFALGVTASLTLAALVTRRPVAAVAALGAVGAALVLAPVDPVALTPYGLYAAPSLATALASVGIPLALAVVGLALFAPGTNDARHRGRRRLADRVVARLPVGPLTRRPLLAVVRSSGSVGKVLFSMGVLFAVTALVLGRVTAATGMTAGAGLAFGTLLGLGAFTTYSWVTQFDDAAEYGRYPVSTGAVLAGKRRAALLLCVPAGLATLAVGVRWFPLDQLLVGALVLPLVATYVLGVSTFLTGFSPNEVLFDTPTFVVFGAALALPAIPLVVAAIARSTRPVAAVAAGVAVALVAALAGLWLGRRSGPRWDERLWR